MERLSLYVEKEKVTYSLHFDYMFLNNSIIKMIDIHWYEEDIEHRFMNVCCSRTGEYALFDLEKENLVQDVWLDDKYKDCSDGYLSTRIEQFIPQLRLVSSNYTFPSLK